MVNITYFYISSLPPYLFFSLRGKVVRKREEYVISLKFSFNRHTLPPGPRGGKSPEVVNMSYVIDGPFTLSAHDTGKQQIAWTLKYGETVIKRRTLPVTLQPRQVVRRFNNDRTTWAARRRVNTVSGVLRLLPPEVMTDDVARWTAPNAWHLRHLIGQGSLLGISAIDAAALFDVSPLTMRKYLACDSAVIRCPIPFTRWHAFLHNLSNMV